MERALKYGDRWIFPVHVIRYDHRSMHFVGGTEYGRDVDESFDDEMSLVEEQIRNMDDFFSYGAEGEFINRRHVVMYYWRSEYLQVTLSDGVTVEIPDCCTEEALSALGHMK